MNNYLDYPLYCPFPRPMIIHLAVEFMNKPVIGAEIGVFEGDNAVNMLNVLNIKKLYLIDYYCRYDGYTEVLNIPDIDEHFQRNKEKAATSLAKYDKQIKLIYKLSVKAIKDIDEELDFVYIDANHSHEYVKQDIIWYFPIVKMNGFIGGHDYFNDNSTGVKKAVDEFVLANNLELQLGLHQNHSDWWIQKP